MWYNVNMGKTFKKLILPLLICGVLFVVTIAGSLNSASAMTLSEGAQAAR